MEKEKREDQNNLNEEGSPQIKESDDQSSDKRDKDIERLNLIDNLERSKTTLQSDENIKNSEAFKTMIDHLDIIYKDMISILKKNNIYPIDSIGKKLDPNLHQAMMEVEDNTKESGTILQEIQKGFMMKDRLLRPSLVGVAKKVNKKDENSSENGKNSTEKN